MARWHKEYLGLTECPRDLSQFELDLFCSRETSWLRFALATRTTFESAPLCSWDF